jgi:hypothetical protein
MDMDTGRGKLLFVGREGATEKAVGDAVQGPTKTVKYLYVECPQMSYRTDGAVVCLVPPRVFTDRTGECTTT